LCSLVAHYLQHIGKIDGPPEVVIFLYICKMAIFVFLSMYHQFPEPLILIEKAHRFGYRCI
ncbi:MAG: hypothetical protein PVG69_10095, partial [Desulfobacterales bacterium]